MKKVYKLILIIVISILFFVSCEVVTNKKVVDFDELSVIEIEVGSSYQLKIKENSLITGSIEFSSSDECVSVDRHGLVYGADLGEATITASFNEYFDTIKIKVIPINNIEVSLSVDYINYNIGDLIIFDVSLSNELLNEVVKYEFITGSDLLEKTDLGYKCISEGEVNVYVDVNGVKSNIVTFTINKELLSDPYLNMTEKEFYENYKKASSYKDAYYRSLHGFMSGDISLQDQAPTMSEYLPTIDGKYVRNSDTLFSSDKNTYYIVDAYGNVTSQVFKGGAYVTLEEVAAYVFAFNEIPANYISKKSGDPKSSIWGKYLRLNNSSFSGSTTKYPYEPVLPNISGCGGNIKYYEMDLGTTGTDCDPEYPSYIYNDGSSITRGAARIVYTRYDLNNNLIIDHNERFVFYTYNHYNDFQEYLNYYGGWGEMFGNITGGGTISSKYDYNPTPYVPTVLCSFKELNNLTIQNVNVNKFENINLIKNFL